MKDLYKLYLLLFFIGLLFISRLFYIQLYTNKYLLNAFNTSIKKEIIIPNRGAIFDRNGKLLVFNKPVYELVVIPMLMEENFNISEFCKLVGIEKNIFINNIKKAKSYSRYLPSVFLPFIPKEKFANIQEKLYKYKGFDWGKRSIRDYEVNGSINILGYIREVSKKEIKKEPSYYQMGDLIGFSGIEKSYEKILRGKKGVKYWLRNKNGVIIGNYNNKKHDIKPVSGNDITLTIDWDLQEYAEKLMYHKKGGIVVIDPKNGEILSLVSSPTVDPHIFTNPSRFKELNKLMKNKDDNPLFDRTTQAKYSPASPFKLLTGLVGLQMKVINNKTTFVCHNGFRYGKKKINCKARIHGVPIDLKKAIAISCNNYFAQVYKKIIEKYNKNVVKGVNEWSEIIKSFGLGDYLFNDLSIGEKGLIPSGVYYNNKYGKKKWNAITIISNSIGQGEINVTPIQLANMVCAIANKGFFYTPHILKSINNHPFLRNNKAKYTKVNRKYYSSVINGMEEVFMIGTGKSFRIHGIRMAGKTGTSQNYIFRNKKIISLPDHSVFVLFAPIKNPKIVVSVVIENGGYGSKWAGPIASLIAERYIKNKNTVRKDLENKMMTSGLKKVYDSITRIKRLKKS